MAASGGKWSGGKFYSAAKLAEMDAAKSAERKTAGGLNVEKLKEMGNEWIKGDHHRIYFNNLAEMYGLETGRYGTGNISSATLDGEKTSNNQARRIASDLKELKIWYDVKKGKFFSRTNYRLYNDRETYTNDIIPKIKAKAS